MKFKSFLITGLLLILAGASFAASREVLERPLAYGPQFPLIFTTTAFEPDTAFLLPEHEVFVQTSYTASNIWGFTDNAVRTDNSLYFNDDNSEGYSVYFDGEVERRFVRVQYGLGESIELQYIYREIRFNRGNMDGMVENFHNTLHIGNANREYAERDQLEVYIYDNESKQVVFRRTDPSDKFRQESMQLGIKYSLLDDSDKAISVSLSSNFNDYYIEKGSNEMTDEEDDEHDQFNDYNITLRYTTLFKSWTLHASLAVTFADDTLLEKSPNEIYYVFLGSNFHIADSWDFLFQMLYYSSPFPSDGNSKIDKDILELSLGLRWFLGQQFALEAGFIENQTMGPQNIDITFFAGTMFHF